MSGKNYPKDLNDAAIAALALGAKELFISDFQKHLPTDCANCGGVGYFVLFVATDGPFQAPSSPRRDGNVSHWYNGWYVGRNQCFSCPDCKGLGYVKPVFQQAEFA